MQALDGPRLLGPFWTRTPTCYCSMDFETNFGSPRRPSRLKSIPGDVGGGMGGMARNAVMQAGLFQRDVSRRITPLNPKLVDALRLLQPRG